WPRLLEPEANPRRVWNFNASDLLFEGLVRDAPVSLEGALDVLDAERVATVELDAFAENELIDEPVRRCAPRFGQARRHGLTRARPDHGVVQRIEGVVRGDGSGKLGRVEPAGCRRKVGGP